MNHVHFTPLLRIGDRLESPGSRIDVTAVHITLHTTKNSEGVIEHTQETSISCFQEFLVKKPSVENGQEQGELINQVYKEFTSNLKVDEGFIAGFTLTPSYYAHEKVGERNVPKFYNYGYTYVENSVFPDKIILAHGFTMRGEIEVYLGIVKSVSSVFRNLPPSHLDFEGFTDEIYSELYGIVYTPFSEKTTDDFVIKSGIVHTAKMEDVWVLRGDFNIADSVLNYEKLIEHKYFPHDYINQNGWIRAGKNPAGDLIKTLNDLRLNNLNNLTVSFLQST